MAGYKESRTPKSKGKTLHHLEVSKGEDGGHVVEHHYESDGMEFHKPKSYVFGEDEGEDLMHHIAKHMNVSGPKDGGGGKAPESEVDEETEMAER